VGDLDSWARENVLHWCLGDRRVGQKLPIEVQHAQKPTELRGGPGGVAVLEMGQSLFQRLGTIGGHLITEESNLGCSEDALCRVDEDPISQTLVEESL
jgi:hypothetical protein